jgi:hypothetical protein
MRSSGRRPGARAVLARLAPAEEAEKEISEIRASLSEHHSSKLFSYGAFLIFIGIALSVFQQFVGITWSCTTLRIFSPAWASSPTHRCSRPLSSGPSISSSLWKEIPISD